MYSCTVFERATRKYDSLEWYLLQPTKSNEIGVALKVDESDELLHGTSMP
jgi:hypothetical protein